MVWRGEGQRIALCEVGQPLGGGLEEEALREDIRSKEHSCLMFPTPPHPTPGRQMRG